MKKRGQKCSSEASADQSSPRRILSTYPITDLSAWFGLLCLQPEPVPRSLTASVSEFPSWYPCRLRSWFGVIICIPRRVWSVLHHAHTANSQCETFASVPSFTRKDIYWSLDLQGDHRWSSLFPSGTFFSASHELQTHIQIYRCDVISNRAISRHVKAPSSA